MTFPIKAQLSQPLSIFHQKGVEGPNYAGVCIEFRARFDGRGFQVTGTVVDTQTEYGRCPGNEFFPGNQAFRLFDEFFEGLKF